MSKGTDLSPDRLEEALRLSVRGAERERVSEVGEGGYTLAASATPSGGGSHG